ncbi:MAG: glycosyl hydrolase family, 32 [Acidobacteriaceae bacterium]|nr:glycosyl hydrolase family, 32 [Acidobacteriaceae bacterium]
MPISRRSLLNAVALASAASLTRRGFSLVGDEQDPDRPAVHLLPARNWINDPCAPLFYKGKYHMFHQYNPHAAVWGDMHWAHATSPDMVHWTRQPVAFAPTPGGADAQGCFTGSALLHEGRPAIIYTGVLTVPREQATLADGNNIFRESQILALPVDDSLNTWTKHAQPVIPAPPAGMKVTGFRDPTPFRLRGRQYLLIGSGEADKGGMLLLYRAVRSASGEDDLTRWEYLHPLLEGQSSGEQGTNPVNTGKMWECPDFFSLGADGKEDESGPWVLIYSTRGKTPWHSGTLDPETLRFHPKKSGQLDYGGDGNPGTFYAPKTQLDAHGNRILWGWLPETRPQADYVRAGWSGMISLPRRMYLNNGDLHMEPAAATQFLRGAANSTANRLGNSCQEFSCVLQAADSGAPTPYRLTDAFGPVLEIRSSPSQDPRTILLSAMRDGDQAVEIKIPERLPAQAGLHLFVDHSVLEIFIDSRFCITRRFYNATGLPYARNPNQPIATLTLPGPCRIVRAQSFSLKPIRIT